MYLDSGPAGPAIQQCQLPVRVEWEVTSSFVQFPEGRATGQSRAGLPRLAPPSGCCVASQWPFGVGAREQFRDLTCSPKAVEVRYQSQSRQSRDMRDPYAGAEHLSHSVPAVLG